MNLRSLFEHAHDLQEFQKGAPIFKEGEPGDVMYVVMDGEIEVRTQQGMIETLGPGDIVGEMALIDEATRSATVTASSDCRLARVDEKRFLYMVDETLFFALHVMRVLVKRLRRRLSAASAATA